MPAPDRPAKDARKAIRVGSYEVINHIATGGMGAVYRARDVKLGREVALKILPPEMARNPTQLERFKREARHAARLRHENIVTLYEFGEDKGTYYIAMELIEGIDLHEYINRKKKLDPEEARRILIQATRGLSHAHKQGLVHRDIKPSNFLIVGQKDKMVVKMTDLGLAREASDDESRMTRSGTTVGTVDYMAPEQARDSRLADTRSDIYSLGCTLFHMLAGQAPFPDGGLTERLYKHAEAELPDVRQFNSKVPDALIAIMNRMLAKRPEDRYQTPGELLKELMGVTNASVSRNDPNVLAGLALAADEKPADSVRRSSGRATMDDVPTTKAYRPPGKQKPVETEFTSQRNPLAWVLLGGVGMLIGLGIVVAILVMRQDKKSSESVKPADKDHQKTVVHDVPLPDERPKKKETKVEPPPPPPKKEEPRWLYKEAGLVKAAELRRQFEEPWKNDKSPANAPVLRVSRGPRNGTGRFNSLAAACVKAADATPTIIEIHDNGPLFEPAMQLMAKHLVVRAAPGYRPLIVWDHGSGNASNPARGSAFCSLRVGSLTLENVDVACKWTDASALDSPVLFQIEDADFRASDCTFSVAGKHSAGLTAVRCDASRPGQKCRLTRCLGRGSNLVALQVRAPAAETLLENCLLVGGDAPLLQVAGHNSAPTNLRLAQSTLVAGQTMLRIGSAGVADVRPAVQVHAWDCLLSHATQGGGELLALAENVDSTSLQWKPTNCLYAGWTTLLAENPPLAWSDFDLTAWHKRWNGAVGDRGLFRAWPGVLATDLAEQPATAYRLPESDKELCYPSTANPDLPIGCDVFLLPPTRDNWENCTYERAVPAAVTMITTSQTPPIPNAAEGEYAGERLDLSKVDLGAHLKEVKNQGLRLATRVVFHLYASGDPQKTRPATPIRVKDSSLVLFFEAPEKAKANSFVVLLATDSATDDPGGFIDVEGGSLEIIGGEIRYPDLGIALLPSYMIKVRQGDLRMHGSTLQGPLGQAPLSYRGLIRFDGASTRWRPEHCLLFGAAVDLPFPGQLPWAFVGNLGTVPDENVPTLGVNECLFVSARNGIHLTGTGARLRVQESVIATGGDAFLLEPGRTAQPSLRTQLSLENDTIAARGAVLHLGDAPHLAFVCDPMLAWSRGVAFLGAFGGGSALLREDGNAVARGWLVWQGEGNFYDKKRLHFYAVDGTGKAADPKSFTELQALLLGSQGERRLAGEATLAGTLSLEGYDRKQLERLALPTQGGKAISAGADLVRLGIVKKRPK
jgi:serine/threonine-protein kinase